MNTVTTFPATRTRRLRSAIAMVRRRIQAERELLFNPRLELAAARQIARSHRRIEVLRSQLR